MFTDYIFSEGTINTDSGHPIAMFLRSAEKKTRIRYQLEFQL